MEGLINARVTARRAKRRPGLELTLEQEVEARLALGEGHEAPSRLHAFPTLTEPAAAMAAIEAWDGEHSLDHLRARRAFIAAPDVEVAQRMAQIQRTRDHIAR